MIEDLVREGLIKKLPVDRKKVTDAIALAHRDVTTSRILLATDHDWAYTIAYNAILQAGAGLLCLPMGTALTARTSTYP